MLNGKNIYQHNPANVEIIILKTKILDSNSKYKSYEIYVSKIQNIF